MVVTEQMKQKALKELEKQKALKELEKQKALKELEKLKVLKQQEEAYASAKGTIEVLGKRKEQNFVIVGKNKYPLATYGDIQKFEELIKQGAIELNKQDAEGLVKVKEQAMIDMGLRKQEQVKTAVSPKKNKIKSKAEQEFDEMFDDAYTIDESNTVDKVDDVVDSATDVAKTVDKADDVVDSATDVAKVVDKTKEQIKQKALDNLEKLKVLKQQEEAYAGAKGINYEPYFITIGERQYSLTNFGDIEELKRQIKQGDIKLNKKDAESLIKLDEEGGLVDILQKKQSKTNKLISEAEQEFDEMFDDTYTIDESKVVDKVDDVVDSATDVAKTVDKADDVVDSATDVAKVVDKTDDIPGAGKISKAAKVTNFLKKNPKIAKILGNKWAKLGGKAVMPATVAYTALKDFEGFNEGDVDFSGNTFQDIGELAEEGTRSALDMGGKFVLNTAEDAVEIGDTILKGLAWGLGQMGDIGNEATKFFGSDKTREEIKKNEVDYSTLFMKAIDDLGLSDKYKKESNKTKAGLNALLYGKDGFDDDVYQRTLDKYNKKLEPEDELINSNADDSGIELGDITPDPKKEAMLVQKDTQPNALKAYQDRQVVKNQDGTYKYLSHQTGDYKDTDEVTGEKLTTLEQVKKQIDKGLTQDYAYRAKKAGDKVEAKKILDDAKLRGYTEDEIGISI